MSIVEPPGDIRIQPDVQRVLVYRLGSLGDTIVALPALHLIARAFPNAERRMLTNVPVNSRAPAAAQVIGDSGLIHSYENYPVGVRNPFKLLILLLHLRKFHPDVIVYLKATEDMHAVRRDREYLSLVGARQIVGLPKTSDEQFARMLPNGTYEHEAWRIMRCLAELGAVDAADGEFWNLHLTGSEQAAADERLQPLNGGSFFAVSVGTKVQAKDWGVQNWNLLFSSLAREYPGRGLVLTGAPEEHRASQEAAAGWCATPGSGTVLNLCGHLTPRQSAAVYRRAIAFLGHDSGPMHLAAAAGAQTLAVFSARNKPETWFPMCATRRVLYHRVDCWGCGLESCVEQRKKCILSITTDEVLKALKTMLPGASEPPYSSHAEAAPPDAYVR